MTASEPERQREIDEVPRDHPELRGGRHPGDQVQPSVLGVLRTTSRQGRGGSRYSTWRLAEAKAGAPLTRAGSVTAGLAWERITYFLERVVPVADEYKVRLACHPHDPGVPPRAAFAAWRACSVRSTA